MASGVAESQEMRTFRRHADLFEEEEDCDCIMDKIKESNLIEGSTLKRIKRSVNKNSKNRWEFNYKAFRLWFGCSHSTGGGKLEAACRLEL